ncbi:MAG: hypothetical protein ABI120_25975 [Gemmatimonadaceae bacterium]
MAYELKDSERRTLKWGAIIGLPVLLYMFAVKPLYASLVDKTELLELERTTLTRERAAIAAAQRNPQLQHIADSLMQIASQRLFSGADDVMASAELGSYIGDVAAKNHFLMTSATTGTVPKTKSSVRTLSEDIRGESDLQGILEFLQALERGPKLVRVSRVDISRQTRDADDIETVLFAATITAYALPPEIPLPAERLKNGADSGSSGMTDAAARKSATGRGGKS